MKMLAKWLRRLFPPPPQLLWDEDSQRLAIRIGESQYPVVGMWKRVGNRLIRLDPTVEEVHATLTMEPTQTHLGGDTPSE